MKSNACMFVLQLADSDKAWEASFFGQTLALRVMDVGSLATLGSAVSKLYSRNIVYFININAAFVFWDMPFGLGLAPWDVLLTGDVLQAVEHHQHLPSNDARLGGALCGRGQGQARHGSCRLPVRAPILRLRAQSEHKGHGLLHLCSGYYPHRLPVRCKGSQLGVLGEEPRRPA